MEPKRLTVGWSGNNASSNSGSNVASSIFTNSPLNYSKYYSDLTGYINNIQDIIQSNNAAAIQAAADQRDWSYRMWQQNSMYNAEEAQKNRDWQEYMSNTAHQREIADLKAAGLNPVLSAMGGNGATVTSGSTASNSIPNGSQANLDQSGAHALVSLLTAFITAQTNLQMANLSARTNEAVADKYTAMDKLIADMNRENLLEQLATSRYVSENSLQGSLAVAGATVQAATLSKLASEYVADHNLEGTRYAKDVEKEIARMNNDAQLDRLNDSQAWEAYIKENYPQTYASLINELKNGAFGQGVNLLGNTLADLFGIPDGSKGSSKGIFSMGKRG